MLYMAADSDDGLLVFLGINDENIKQIRLDNPLIAQLSYVNHHGFFFVYHSETSEESPKMKEIRGQIGRTLASWACMGVTTEELDALQANKGFFAYQPKDKIVGVDKIAVMYCNDHKSFIASLRKHGLIGPDVHVHMVPKSLDCN